MTLKKFTLAILLTFTLTIAYQVFAAYLTSPENLKYPNPGHYPGEIGPGTFNCSDNTNCYWRFPNALFINSTSGKVGIGTENPTETLEVQGNTKIQGNLEVIGKGNFFELCIQGNCTTFWPVAGAGGECVALITSCGESGSSYGSCPITNCIPPDPSCPTEYPNKVYTNTTRICLPTYSDNRQEGYVSTAYKITTCCKSTGTGGGGGGIGGFKDCEIVEKECCCEWDDLDWCDPTHCEVSCPSNKWLISGGGKCSNTTYGSGRTEGIYESYPKTAGKGGTWYVHGRAYEKHADTLYYCTKAYALCCNFTGGAGTVEDIWVNETGDTMTGDLKVEGGIVVGNPAGGNKGPGTINAEKIYVNGSEISSEDGVLNPEIIAYSLVKHRVFWDMGLFFDNEKWKCEEAAIGYECSCGRGIYNNFFPYIYAATDDGECLLEPRDYYIYAFRLPEYIAVVSLNANNNVSGFWGWIGSGGDEKYCCFFYYDAPSDSPSSIYAKCCTHDGAYGACWDGECSTPIYVGPASYITSPHTYTIKWHNTSKVCFYLDGIEKGCVTSSLPPPSIPLRVFHYLKEWGQPREIRIFSIIVFSGQSWI